MTHVIVLCVCVRGGGGGGVWPLDTTAYYTGTQIQLELVYLPVGKYCVYPRMVYRQAMA